MHLCKCSWWFLYFILFLYCFVLHCCFIHLFILLFVCTVVFFHLFTCNYYLVLSFLLMYSSSGLSTDVFPNKTNINTHISHSIYCNLITQLIQYYVSCEPKY